ncbi:MAG: hypothetical protein E7165_03170 [Firmicutes bacterium]|nr:hypothetical protein [Bacillota bacterium]
MRRTRSRQMTTIAIIMVAVVGMGIGFAAFATNLTINSGAAVNPDASTFSVKFSSSATDIARDSIKGVANPTTLSTTDGEIDAIEATTISGMGAEFIEPGQSVTYTFYARNIGAYQAYLNMIEVGNKVCTPGEGTDATLVAEACKSMSITVTVDGTTSMAVSGTQSSIKKVANHTLAADSSEEIVVTLEYVAGGARADGPFDVTFGDVSLTYSTIGGYDVPVTCTAGCGDVNDDGVVNQADYDALFQSFNGYEVYINESQADVNSDGKVNNRDLLALNSFLSGTGSSLPAV